MFGVYVHQSRLDFISSFLPVWRPDLFLLSQGFSFVSSSPCLPLLVLAFLLREGFKAADSPQVLLAHGSTLCLCHCNEKEGLSRTVTSPPSTHSLLSSLCLLSSPPLALRLMVDGWSCDVIIPWDFLPAILCRLTSSLDPFLIRDCLILSGIQPLLKDLLLVYSYVCHGSDWRLDGVLEHCPFTHSSIYTRWNTCAVGRDSSRT